MRTGQTVQFQVRDGETADEDLRHLLQQQQHILAGKKSHAALALHQQRGEACAAPRITTSWPNSGKLSRSSPDLLRRR